MKYLKTYESMYETIYIFDFDNTIVDSPKFEDLVKPLILEDSKSLLMSEIKKIGIKLSDLKWENGKIYFLDKENRIIPNGNWIKRGSRIYLKPPDSFSLSDESLPLNLKELADKYNSVKNKAIVTGRSIKIKNKIIKILDKFGLDQPDLGIFCYPLTGESGVSHWKSKTIVEIIKKTGAKKVYFYDDRSKWLKAAKNLVNKELPEVDFITKNSKLNNEVKK